MAQKAQMDEGRGEGTPSPGAAVESVCPDWHELSEHQRVRSVELFEAGRRFERGISSRKGAEAQGVKS